MFDVTARAVRLAGMTETGLKKKKKNLGSGFVQ